MSSDLDKHGEGTETVGQKLDTLSASVDQRFDTLSASVDERFDAVDVALIEQRQYTEFAFSSLEAKMDAGFARFDERFARSDERFDRMERKLDQFIDVQLQTNQLVDRRLTALEKQPGRT